MEGMPRTFVRLQKQYGRMMTLLHELGQAAGEAGPLDRKTAHLIQLGAAAAMHSEGAVRSHARRALAEGATPAEVLHAVVVLIPTIGFPTVAAAFSWLEELTGDQ